MTEPQDVPAPPLPPNPKKPPPITPANDRPAPLVDVVMYNLLGEDWKSTMQGAFSFLALYGAGMAIAVNEFAAGYPKLKSVCSILGLAITAVSGIAKWYIGIKQKG